MKSICISNLRSLLNTGDIELKPVTLLVGRNNSGKSTFLRSLPLLRQSYESISTGPLLWFGKYVDFGSFNVAVNKYAEVDPIILKFSFNLEDLDLVPFIINENKVYEVSVIITISRLKNDAFTKQIELIISEHIIKMVFNQNHTIEYLKVNEHEFHEGFEQFLWSLSSGPIPGIREKKERNGEKNSFFRYSMDDFNIVSTRLWGNSRKKSFSRSII